MVNKPILIGIAGGSASGKTSIAKIIYETFKDTSRIVIVSEDSFYKDQSHLTMEERVKTNYDHPLAFDHDLMLKDLQDLAQRKKVTMPIYDFSIHNRSTETNTVEPADVIIIEGLFVLYNEDVRNLLDIKIFAETADDIRFIRRLKRDIVERKRTVESVCDQYLQTVKPMFDQFVEPTKKYADVIIPDGMTNAVAIDLLNTKINSILKEKML